jgi:hypothetical protein
MKQTLFVLLLILLAVPVQAQVPAADSSRSNIVEFVEILLDDGSKLVGTVLSETESDLLFRTASGVELQIDPTTIKRRRMVEGRMYQGSFEPFDPTLSRTLFAPTARSVPAGTGYVVLHEVFFLSGAWGPGAGVTFSGGLSLIPGAGEQLVWFAPKFTFVERERVSVAGGLLAGTLIGSSDAGGVLYGVSSFGSRARTGTVGVGFLFGGGEVDDTPIILFSGDWALGDRTSLISENYALPTEGSGSVISLGLRFRGSRLTMDLAGITHTTLVKDGQGMAIIPWVGITRNF